jgi:hypothetical protein
MIGISRLYEQQLRKGVRTEERRRKVNPFLFLRIQHMMRHDYGRDIGEVSIFLDVNASGSEAISRDCPVAWLSTMTIFL